MQEHEQKEQEFSFKSYFVPLTSVKASSWIVIIGLIVYFNMLFNGFVWDDFTYILLNPGMQSLNISAQIGPNVFNAAGQYRPLTSIYFNVLYSIFNTNPFFYHILQLSLYIFCSILLFFLFRKFLSPGLSLFLALIALVHPINIESASYISQSDTPLFLIFGILPLFITMRERLSLKDYLIIFFSLLLSFLTKEAGILFLFLIFIYRFLFMRKNLVKFSVIGTLTVAVYVLIRIFIGHVVLSNRSLTPIADLPLSGRLVNVPMIIFYYIKTIFYPARLAVDQQWVVTSVNFSSFYLPLFLDLLFFLLLICIGVYIFKYSKDKLKLFLFFFLWFLSGLFLYIQIIPLDFTVADRWFYFPLVGLLGMIGIFSETFYVRNKKINKQILIITGIVVIVLLSVRTIIRNADWQNALTLFTHDIRYSDNFDIENNLGSEYENRLNFTKAIPYLKRSVVMRPFEYNLLNLAISYEATGNTKEANTDFRLIENDNTYGMFQPHRHDLKFYNGYALFLVFYEKNSSAIPLILNGLHDYPNTPSLWFYLALAYDKAYEKQKALYAAAKAYQLAPNTENKYVYNNLQKNKAITINFDSLDGRTVNLSIDR